MKQYGVTEKEIHRMSDKKVIPGSYEGECYLVIKGAAGGYFSTVWYESSKVTAHVNAKITVEILKNVAKKFNFSCVQCIDTFYTKKNRFEEEIVLKVDEAFHDLIILYREEKKLRYRTDKLLEIISMNINQKNSYLPK